ncbi:D-(-)-3-hydroxybutyrate oligomer hydrolase [Aquincola sp. S2]|uniref:D-(-)-3-hydroxybutyrate oligomer hydrolase n=1 Tax=Pseudaquabacterium terrae TaxID=2732868 RepID=A0ABX2ET53_9BURK|nr:3-hydroxybutyrate oligomer hydrolase family protein [Aquabacterium terrae]NRF71884.1 D-(-)-3-hydroxybutyrate oligomer hydrolase [Aquabacterium terrae]
MTRQRKLLICAAAATLLAACGDDTEVTSGPVIEFNAKPAYIGTVRSTSYDGNADDLLTAGLGRSGLASAVAPTTSATPTAAELRRLTIYNNYRALVDMTANGGYGVFYGPGITAEGTAPTSEGKIAGTELLTFSDDGSGRRNVTLMVQIPDSFSPDNACIVTATSSGSRGVYGGISTGEWGLKRGCAVAYTDKGTGGAPHDLANDTVPLIDGTRSSAASAGATAQFRANLTAAELAALNTATPNRFAFKHAHSQQNPEKDWGTSTLQAVEFAFWALNEKYGALLDNGQRERRLKASNTLVIASSISNGGGAAIAAAEADAGGLIDGVAVAEPAVELPANPGVTVQRGVAPVPLAAKTLVDFTSYANLFQSCAALSTQTAGAPGAAFVVAAFATNRCASLKAKGLLAADTPAAQADEALQKLRDYGWEPEAAILHASHAAFEVASAVTVTFANSLSRSSVKDHLCGYSYGSTTAAGVPNALAPAPLATMAATGNGVPPSSGVQLINNLSPGAPLRDLFSFSPSTMRQDFNLDGALCLRDLLSGSSAPAQALRSGLDETRRSGNLRGKPALIVHGRADALLPVNHTSRPYTALNKKVEGAASKLSYIEVANAQHFDGFIGLPALLPGYDSRYVPLHLYLNRALDAMYAHLKNGTALPASQVVRTVPRGGTPGTAPALTAANVPAIAAAPAAANAITMSGTTLTVPD